MKDSNPAWTPDGPQFLLHEDKQVRAPNIPDLKDARETRDFAWSTDSTRVAFTAVRNRHPFNGSVEVINANGTERRKLTGGTAYSRPLWSPNGRRILAQEQTGSRVDLVLIDVDDARVRKLGVQGEQAAWSPDGTRIAYVARCPDAEVFVVNRDGTGRERITFSPKTDEEQPTWAPDGSRVAFKAVPFFERRLSW